MKKYKIYILISFVLFLFSITQVDAASVVLKRNYTSITKGGYVTVSATVSSDSPIVSIEGTLSCTGAGSATISMALDDSSNQLYSKTFSTTLKGSSIGTITCSATGVRITSMASGDWQYLGNQSATIQVTAPKTYSSNNNLASLSIDGYELSPIFSKSTLEYSVSVPNEVRQVNINATKEDGTANIAGTGVRDLIEGANRIEIVVTAENGATKTYVINVTVKDLDPIAVKVDTKEYNVVRKKEQLTIPEFFTESTTIIDAIEVPALTNEKLGYTLVGLKDDEGKVELYIYDQENKSYTLYKEYKFKTNTIFVLDNEEKIPEGYKKANLKLGEENIIAYKLNDSSKYYLFYGINVETGKENLYVYDSVEKTIQRYNNEDNNNSTDKEELYQYMIIGLGTFLIITYLVLLISLISNSKKKKRLRIKKMSEKEELNRKKEKDKEKEKELEKTKEINPKKED
jgi:hypothetical protein